MIVLKGTIFTIYPKGEQRQKIRRFLGCCRFVWNRFLERNILSHMFTGKFIFYSEMAKCLPVLKEKYPWLSEAPSQALQQTLRDLDFAIRKSFRENAGFPKFRSRNSGFDSMRFPQGFRISSSGITLPKLGEIPCLFRKEIGKARNVTLKWDHLKDRFLVSVCHKEEAAPLPETGKALGLDMGVTRLFTDSDGNFEQSLRDHPKVKYFLERIGIEQRKLSHIRESFRKGNRKIGKYLKKKRKTLGLLHRKLADFVRDILHRLSRKLVDSNDLIVAEDLKIRNMTKSARGNAENPGRNVRQKAGLNRNLLSNRLSAFTSMLEYKCLWAGRRFLKVDPKFTSRTCSACGGISKESRKSQAEFRCVFCGHEMNADHNAAINILNKAGLWTGSA